MPVTGYRILIERDGDMTTVMRPEDCKFFGQAETTARLLSDVYGEHVVVQEWRDGEVVDPALYVIAARRQR